MSISNYRGMHAETPQKPKNRTKYDPAILLWGMHSNQISTRKLTYAHLHLHIHNRQVMGSSWKKKMWYIHNRIFIIHPLKKEWNCHWQENGLPCQVRWGWPGLTWAFSHIGHPLKGNRKRREPEEGIIEEEEGNWQKRGLSITEEEWWPSSPGLDGHYSVDTQVLWIQ